MRVNDLQISKHHRRIDFLRVLCFIVISYQLSSGLVIVASDSVEWQTQEIKVTFLFFLSEFSCHIIVMLSVTFVSRLGMFKVAHYCWFLSNLQLLQDVSNIYCPDPVFSKISIKCYIWQHAQVRNIGVPKILQ